MKILALLCCSLLAGCAATPAPATPASKGEQAEATRQYMNCLIPYAKQMDDGRSDAQTIARAMAGACPPEFNTYLETITRGNNNYVTNELRAQGPAMQERSALNVVLQVRRASK